MLGPLSPVWETRVRFPGSSICGLLEEPMAGRDCPFTLPLSSSDSQVALTVCVDFLFTLLLPWKPLDCVSTPLNLLVGIGQDLQ